MNVRVFFFSCSVVLFLCCSPFSGCLENPERAQGPRHHVEVPFRSSIELSLRRKGRAERLSVVIVPQPCAFCYCLKCVGDSTFAIRDGKVSVRCSKHLLAVSPSLGGASTYLSTTVFTRHYITCYIPIP